MLLGVDIGGTSVKFGVVDEKFNIVHRSNLRTEKGISEKDFLAAVAAECAAIAKEYPIERIGAGSPGYVDMDAGVIKMAVNLPFKDTPVAKYISDATGIPTVVGNDATCAAIGELYAGLGAGVRNMVFVTIGTGIGGGIVIDRKIYLGTRGDAGEIGHICVNVDGEQCGCGRRGCWELYASVTALKKRTARAAKAHPNSILARQVEQEGVSGRTAFNAARMGCKVAQLVLDRYLDYLAVGIGNLICIFRPDVVALGGGLSGEGEGLLRPLCAKLNSDIPVEISKLRNDAGMIGAAMLHRSIEEAEK